MLTVRPKIAELSLSVFGRTIHPELYRTQKVYEVVRSNYCAKLEITGSGHVFHFRSELVNLTEVTASSHQPLPSNRLLTTSPFTVGYQELSEVRGKIGYHSEFQIEKITPEMFWTFQQELSRTTPQNGVIHEFDSSGRMPIGGISYVHTVARDKTLLVQAFHTFPDDQAIVKTRTEFRIRE